MKRHKRHHNFIVYCATFPSGMKYVGVTGRTLKERKKDHKNSERNNPFHNALKKYYNEVVWEVVKEFTDCEEAYKYEQKLIESIGLFPNSYNYTLGGGYASGYKLPPRTKEHRRKLSKAGKLRTGNKNSFYGKTHSEESKRKISQSKLGTVPVNKKPIVDQFDHIYADAKEAYKHLGVGLTSIYQCAKGEKDSIKGWRLRYVEI